MKSRLRWALVASVFIGITTYSSQVSLAAPVPLSRITQVYAGEGSYALALRHDGIVLGWGNNTTGTLGNGTTDPSLTPTPVPGLAGGSPVIALAPSFVFALALKADGTVLGWGSNTLGQLGNKSFTSSLTPVQVFGLGPGSPVPVTAIATGLSHAVAVKGDGSVWAWGSNNNNNLGNPSIAGPSNVPVPVSGLGPGAGITAVAAGGNFTLVLGNDHTVWGWGNNNNGQLGIGNTNSQPVPVQVKGVGGFGVLSDIVAISAPPNAGGSFALALRSDGTVWAWGNNANGQLGDGTNTNHSTPVQVTDVGGLGVLTGVTAIDAGGTGGNLHSLAVKSDGTVLAWGSNANGQLGTGDHTASNSPAPVQGLGPASGVVAVSAASGLSLARTANGSVLAWGDNSAGELGNGSFFGSSMPEPVAGLGSGSTVMMIASGNGANHSLALRADGSVLAWGSNASGQLCTGDTTNRTTPVVVPMPGPVIAVAVGANHSLVLTSDHLIWACGDNSSRQLGTGDTVPSLVPVAVKAFVGNPRGAAIAACANNSMLLTATGTVAAWGNNGNGQLGNNTMNSPGVAAAVHGVGNVGFLGNVTAIACNAGSSYALQADGTMLGWGQNAAGQLGDDAPGGSRLTPVQVAGLGSGSGVVAIAAIAGGAAALNVDGSVVAWGLNGSGQVGDGTAVQRSAPVPVVGLGAGSGVTSLAGGGTVGDGQTLARKSDGSVWSWGANGSGQLGDGTLLRHTIPAPVAGLGSGIASVSAGASHSVALADDGTVLAWGANGVNQLGDGAVFTSNLTPSDVLIDDVTPPTMGVASPTPLFVTASGTFTILEGASDADSGVSQVSVSVQGPTPSSASVGSVPLTLQSGDAFDGGWSGAFTFPAGTPDGVFTLVASGVDAAGNSSTVGGGVVFLDRAAPVVTLSASASIVWPPNGKMVPVTFSGTITDATSGVDPASITYAVTDEYGTVQPTGPITVGAGGSYTFTVSLQASRNDDDLDGRRYVISVSASDKAANRGTSTVVVIVPHDRSGW